MIKILHLYTALDDGGVERFLLNYYQEMDRVAFKFDVVVPGGHIGILEKQFLDLGCHVYHVTRFSDSPMKNIRETAAIIKRGNYNIIHCHGYKSVEGLLLGWIIGIKTRIIHSHMVIPNESILTKIKRIFIVLLCKIFATDRWACGIDAGKWLYGKRDFGQGKFTVVPNAININAYRFNLTARDQLRKEFKISSDVKIIGNVARLSLQKNQEFLLESFAKVSNQERYVLFLVGSGELKDELEAKATQLHINNNVRFLGSRTDVPALLSMFDLFILPSKFEGLPVSLVEAQAAGLPCLASSTITEEVNVTGNIKYLSLDLGSECWEREIVQTATKVEDRNLYAEKMKNGMFDIVAQSDKLQNLYLNIDTQKRSKRK